MRPRPFLLLIAGVALALMLSLFDGVSAEEETVSISVNVPMKGDYPDETNVSQVYWWSMDIALGENFTFTFIADNLENGTEYVFSYEIVNIRGDPYANASHLFIANNTEEYSYNLDGQLVSDYMSNCSKLVARVGFVKNPNSDNGTQKELATFSTDAFYPSGYIFEECYEPSNSPPFGMGPVETILDLLVGLVFVVFPIVLVIAFFKGAVAGFRRFQNK